MLSVRMRFVLLMCFMAVAKIGAASIKKSINESVLKAEISTKPSKTPTGKVSKSPAPAIVAIEIIDEPQLTNSSSAPKNNTKRTVESSVGYGYQSPLGHEPQKKFVIYKYSQQDIPPIAYSQFDGGYNMHAHAQANIQQGIGYHLGSTSAQIGHQSSVELKSPQPEYGVPETQYYNPENTVYTTLNNQGHLGGLSPDIPYQNVGHSGMVPVIILRVYSNQLSSPHTALHTNLPQSHPYSSLNNINLQSLLQTYVQQYLQSQQGVQHYQPQAYQQEHQQVYHAPEEYHPNLPTYENYPSEQHTRVIFHSNNNGHIPEQKSMFKTAGLSTYKTVSVPAYHAAPPSYTEVQTPDSQYGYSSGTQDQNYMYVYPNQVEQEMYYQPENQDYQLAHSQQEQTQHVPPTATQNSPEVPYNYHAHPSGPKQKRSKKNSNIVSSILPAKRREPRDKTP